MADFEIVFASSFEENAKIEVPGHNRINLRVTQSVGGSDKVHGLDYKMFPSGGSGESTSGAVMLIVDPKTMLIDKKSTETILKKIDDKKATKFYKDNVDIAGGAILYAADELRDLMETEKSKGSASFDAIDKKMTSFSDLYKTNKKEFKRYIDMSNKGKLTEGGMFDNVVLI